MNSYIITPKIRTIYELTEHSLTIHKISLIYFVAQ